MVKIKERFVDGLVGSGVALALGLGFMLVAGFANKGNPLAYASLEAGQFLLVYAGAFFLFGFLNMQAWLHSNAGYWAHPLTGLFEPFQITEDGYICEWVE